MGKSLLLLNYHYSYCSTLQFRTSFPVIGTRLNYSTAGKKNSSHRINYGCSGRTPLSEVVSDCERRWFEGTLREAEAGDIEMQVLVGQMYTSGYGVPKDVTKGRAWIDRAAKNRSSASMLGDEHPGYHTTSDDDSDSQQQGSY